MNKLQAFLSTLPCGFITEAQMPQLIALDRLCPVLVRCGCCRFTCGAQDLAHLTKCIEAGGDYIRDVSLPVGWEARAATWQPECPVTPGVMLPASFIQPRPANHRLHVTFSECDCGGVYDGHQVTSDADPGL